MYLPQQQTSLASHQKLNSRDQQSHKDKFQEVGKNYLLQAVLEGFVDGIVILTEHGELVHANEYARRICHQLREGGTPADVVATQIKRVCQALIESRQMFPDQKMTIDAEVETDETVKLRVRARWFHSHQVEQPLVLVTLEDRQQYTQVAIADAKKYNLTEREAEVWRLRRANYSYKEIAAQLYITINTVKKHLKNVYAKQQELSWAGNS